MSLNCLGIHQLAVSPWLALRMDASAPQNAPVFNLVEPAPWRWAAFPNSPNELPELGSGCLGSAEGGPGGSPPCSVLQTVNNAAAAVNPSAPAAGTVRVAKRLLEPL